MHVVARRRSNPRGYISATQTALVTRTPRGFRELSPRCWQLVRSQEAAMSRFVLRKILTAIAITCAAVAALPLAHARHSESSIIYTMSNAAAGNELVAFRQARNGTLIPLASHATGG